MLPALLLLLSTTPAAQRHVVDDDDAVDVVAGAVDDGDAAPLPPPVLTLGVHAGGSIGIPLVGAVGRVNARWQPFSGFSVEPHLDVGVLMIPAIGVLDAAVGVPVVVTEDRGPGLARPYLGVGPFVASAIVVAAGVKAAAINAAGAEVVFGFRWRVPAGDVQAQVSVFGGVSDNPGFGYAGGVVGSLGFDFDVL